MESQVHKEITKATIQANYEAASRREDAFNCQFYSNSSNEHINIKQLMNRSDGNDENIRIYVDQWDGEGAEKRCEDTSSDPYNANECNSIRTAKNSPLESGHKEPDSSEKYSVTEESAEKHLSGFKNESNAFDYQASTLQVKRNLQSTLQENLQGSIESLDNQGFLLTNPNAHKEADENYINRKLHYEEQNGVPEHPNMVSPAENEALSPSNFDETKCIVLSNSK